MGYGRRVWLRGTPSLEISPPWGGGNHHLGPASIGNTRRRRCQRKLLQGAEPDLHCHTMVQICGAVPPRPPSLRGGDCHFVTVPPPPRRPHRGGTGPTKGGRSQGGGVRVGTASCRGGEIDVINLHACCFQCLTLFSPIFGPLMGHFQGFGGLLVGHSRSKHAPNARKPLRSGLG